MSVEEYYGLDGNYLEDHQEFLNLSNQKRDVDFLIKALELQKEDRILDLQCAQGRLSIELASQGFDVTGVDFSGYMLDLAQKSALEMNLDLQFKKQDIQNMRFAQKFNKIFIFFPDWSEVDLVKLLQSVAGVMPRGGWFFYDHDNLFRLWNFLAQNQNESWFDANQMLFLNKEEEKAKGDRYYVMTELEKIYTENGFNIVKKMGGWEWGQNYDWSSPRLRLVAEKR